LTLILYFPVYNVSVYIVFYLLL